MEYIRSQEQLVKEVMDRGNSGGVYLPKSWVGQKVIIRPLSVNEYILNEFAPYMKDIVGIYLYGSYARGEEAPDSDIDVLIVADGKVPVSDNGLDVEVVDVSRIRKLVREDPVGYYSMVREAKSIANKTFLDELKQIGLDTGNIGRYIKETKSVMSMVKKLLELEGDSSGSVYSLILRLRGLYLVKCNLAGRRYTNQKFEDFVVKKGVGKARYRKMYAVYRAKRDDRALPPYKIPVKDIKKLYKIVEETLKEMGKWLKERKGP